MSDNFNFGISCGCIFSVIIAAISYFIFTIINDIKLESYYTKHPCTVTYEYMYTNKIDKNVFSKKIINKFNVDNINILSVDSCTIQNKNVIRIVGEYDVK